MERCPLNSLKPDGHHSTIIGVVISCRKPRAQPEKYAQINKRYVFNFSVKDEHNQSINASCWGMVDYVLPISSICHIGAFVKITNPRIRDLGMSERAYYPEVSSQCKLELVENVSTVVVYECDDPYESLSSLLSSAFRTPLPSAYDYVTIHDILCTPVYLEGDFVNLVVLVAAVGPVRDVTTKDGRLGHRLEVKVMDRTNKIISLILWDSMAQQFAMKWEPFVTVVHLMESKIAMDRYTNRKILTGTARSIYTIDPQTGSGSEMATFAAHHLPNPAILEDLLQQQSDDKFHRDEAKKVDTVAALHHMISQMDSGCRQQALLSCFVTSFHLEEGRVLFWKCVKCGRRVSPYTKNNSKCLVPCSNPECTNKYSRTELEFDVSVSVSDATGTLVQCRLKGDAAEQAFAVKPSEFVKLSDEERRAIESRYLLERCEVGVRVEHRDSNKTFITILHLESFPFPNLS